MSREIITTNGMAVIIDDEDYELVSNHTWSCNQDGYPITSLKIDGKLQLASLHRLIVGFPPYAIDHANGNKLDNRRSNLRRANHQQNAANQPKRLQTTSSSIYKGVRRQGTGWTARIKVNYRGHYLGMFKTELEAARAYDHAAITHFGEFASLNLERDGEVE